MRWAWQLYEVVCVSRRSVVNTCWEPSGGQLWDGSSGAPFDGGPTPTPRSPGNRGAVGWASGRGGVPERWLTVPTMPSRRIAKALELPAVLGRGFRSFPCVPFPFSATRMCCGAITTSEAPTVRPLDGRKRAMCEILTEVDRGILEQRPEVGRDGRAEFCPEPGICTTLAPHSLLFARRSVWGVVEVRHNFCPSGPGRLRRQIGRARPDFRLAWAGSKFAGVARRPLARPPGTATAWGIAPAPLLSCARQNSPAPALAIPPPDSTWTPLR